MTDIDRPAAAPDQWEAAEHAVIADALADRLGALAGAARADYVAALTGSNRRTRARTSTVDVCADDGTVVGSVTLRGGGNDTTTVAKVTDEKALFAFVADNMPERIVSVIDPVWLRRLLDTAKKTGTTACPDSGMAVVPGITISTEPVKATAAVTVTDAGKNRAAALLARVAPALLELPAAEGENTP